MAKKAIGSVQCVDRKKMTVAVTYCKRGCGLIKINGCPIELVEPEILRFKSIEPILLLGRQRLADIDMRIRVKGEGHTSHNYEGRNMNCIIVGENEEFLKKASGPFLLIESKGHSLHAFVNQELQGSAYGNGTFILQI